MQFSYYRYHVLVLLKNKKKLYKKETPPPQSFMHLIRYLNTKISKQQTFFLPFNALFLPEEIAHLNTI